MPPVMLSSPRNVTLCVEFERIARHLPRRERLVHVLIELQRAVLDEAHGADGGDEFRQRRGLIERVRRRVLAIGAGKGDAALIDQRDAQPTER